MISQIIPPFQQAESVKEDPDGQAATHAEASRLGRFLRIYGWPGVLLVGVFQLSGAWSLYLALIQLAPTSVANYLMGTEDLDYGDFWMLVRADHSLSIPAALLLMAFAVGYFSLVIAMLQSGRTSNRRLVPTSLRSRRVEPQPAHAGPATESNCPCTHATVVQRQWCGPRARCNPQISRWLRRIVRWILLYLDTGRFEKHPLVSLPKLLLQTTTLFTYLREGFPVVTIVIYASLLLVNWLISAYYLLQHSTDPYVANVRLFSSFDLFFAVLAPMQMLVYAYKTFSFDRAEFATRAETLFPGNFDVVARLFADPVEVSRFRMAFRSLELVSVTGLGVKVALNVLTIRRWWEVIALFKQRDDDPVRTDLAPGSHKWNRTLAAAFVCAGGGIFCYATVAVVSSTRVCARFPQCHVPSYQWNAGADQCSCTVFVDRHTLVKTWSEWEDPTDATAALAALALTGDLKVVQIVNRAIPTLPSELRNCRELEQLILIYTKTLAIPDWANELNRLEYIHIEGDLTARQMTYMPDDWLQDRPRLVFLHLGCLPQLRRVPKLGKLPQLKYLVLAMLHSIQEMPSFDGLVALEQLTVVDSKRVYEFPSVHKLNRLAAFSMVGQNPTCCNGFLNGVCDLNNFSCRDRTAIGEPRVACTGSRLSSSDFEILNRAADGTFCDVERMVDLGAVTPTRLSSDAACGGIKYKRCSMNGATGMCFPARLSVVNCDLQPIFQAMRRLQIQRSVGEPCDPDVEGWLGCTPRR